MNEVLLGLKKCFCEVTTQSERDAHARALFRDRELSIIACDEDDPWDHHLRRRRR